MTTIHIDQTYPDLALTYYHDECDQCGHYRQDHDEDEGPRNCWYKDRRGLCRCPGWEDACAH